jgi:hypothetical protein
MKYEELHAISREELQSELDSGERERVSRALVRAALHDADREWLEDLLAKHLEHPDSWVRGVAATCTGHAARIHRALDLERMLPLLEKLMSSTETAGRAQDALDDIEVFITRAHGA